MGVPKKMHTGCPKKKFKQKWVSPKKIMQGVQRKIKNFRLHKPTTIIYRVSQKQCLQGVRKKNSDKNTFRCTR